MNKLELRDGWVTQNSTCRKLSDAGYSIAGYMQQNKNTGERRAGYILKNKETNEIVLDTFDTEKLNIFVRLLIGGE
jgi:hypothetical protein